MPLFKLFVPSAVALLLLGLIGGTHCDVVYNISSASELIEFAKLKVTNNSLGFKVGTTVYLTNDLDFSSLSGSFSPMSNMYGVFNGLGHKISNLRVSSTSQHVGLFGSSGGVKVTDLVIDSSCSFTGTYSNANDDGFVSAFVGYCNSFMSSFGCIIENSVNLASVTFSGTAKNIFMGPFFTAAVFMSAAPVIRNCANYGTVKNSGSASVGYVGGIGGGSASGLIQVSIYVYNSLNAGTVQNTGSVTTLYIGGIIGGAYDNSRVENSINTGAITSSSGNQGSIAGGVNSNSTIKNCYWSTTQSATGTGSCKNTYAIPFNTNLVLTSSVTSGSYTGTSLVDALNNFPQEKYVKLAKWAVNPSGSAITFNLNAKTLFSSSSKVLLLPWLKDTIGYQFSEWYTDVGCNTPLTDYTLSAATTTLYGKFEINSNSYTISFDTNGGNPISSITAVYYSYVSLPKNPSKTNHNFVMWVNDNNEEVPLNFQVPSHDVTLHAVWANNVISTAADLMAVSDAVAAGVSYSGITVTLAADIDFTSSQSSSFVPIGQAGLFGLGNHFNGVFDGQGHTIKNLKVTSTDSSVGLFGAAGNGCVIKNFVLDSSCSFTSSLKNTAEDWFPQDSKVGGVAGTFSYGTIESVVNMASLSFTGDTLSKSHYIGGIAGVVNGYGASLIKNCVNYGAVSITGSGYNGTIGGIVGDSQGSSGVAYKNCANFGSLSHGGSVKGFVKTGGIVGHASGKAIVENCLSAGAFTSGTAGYTGGMIGEISTSASSINNSYWDSTILTSCYGKNTNGASATQCYGFDASLILTSSVTVYSYTGTSLVSALNAYPEKHYMYNEYSNWVSNAGEHNVTFNVNGRTYATFSSKVVLLPSLGPIGMRVFDGWYTDVGCNTLLTDYTLSAAATTLYGKYEQAKAGYAISFDVQGGNEIPHVEKPYESTVTLPKNLAKKCSIFLRWAGKNSEEISSTFKVPSHNVTLRAVWLDTCLSNPEDFEQFIRYVNSASSATVLSMTVTLDADIDLDTLPQDIAPIGKHFAGVFDGRGHRLTNLKVRTADQYAGLFGYVTQSLVIRNLVLSSSSSIIGTGTKNSFVGAFVGQTYYSSSSSFFNLAIESCVNMANVTFSGNGFGSSVYVGGLIGKFDGYSGYLTIKNCANFGDVDQSGISNYTYLGGLSGYVYTTNSSDLVRTKVLNTINYGHVKVSGTAHKYAYIGGLLGQIQKYFTMTNCVSAYREGAQALNSNSNSNTNIGGIAGWMNNPVNKSVSNCYWDERVSPSPCRSSPRVGLIVDSLSYSEGNSSVVEKLNANAGRASGWSEWVLNSGAHPVVLFLDGEKYAEYRSPMVLLPTVAGSTPFCGWFTDENCTVRFDAADSEISGPTNLYAKYADPDFVCVSPEPSESSHAGGDDTATQRVRIVLSGNDFSESQIDTIIRKIANRSDDCYAIAIISYNENRDTVVIIEFKDTEAAKDFMQKAGEYIRNNDDGGHIKDISYIEALEASFSAPLGVSLVAFVLAQLLLA